MVVRITRNSRNSIARKTRIRFNFGTVRTRYQRPQTTAADRGSQVPADLVPYTERLVYLAGHGRYVNATIETRPVE